MERTRIEEAARRVYRFMTRSQPEQWGDHEWTDWAMNMDRWDWNSGVGVIAAAEFGRTAAGAAEGALREVEAWVERNRGRSEEVRVINSIAPFAVFPALFEMTGDPFYAEKTEEIARWLIDEAPRTRDGAFEHTVTERATFSEQIWADTVFMAVLFLARAARLLGDRRMAGEALEQACLHLRALQDEESGLLFHGWNCAAGNWMSAALWNRANAWNAAAVPMILEEAEDLCDDAGLPDEVKSRYRRLAEGLLAAQNESGLWPTVLDRPSYYEETSGSAGIAFGLYKAVRRGLVPASALGAADRALSAVLGKIEEDGAAGGVSGGTPVLASVEAYNEVPIFPTLYGQGLTLLLLSEALNRG
ncbi:glycoside hydrolase family 88 protein [Cohnella xylanilytica]|uniref:Glycoside hydrolase family 88 protein n=1 Tax=Cohnella xylanilytica TaxID=557555 RepID=A0A841TY73_9BACL|nr:glycoside hydrolase family 88 protein [Cohnella xylanilytica]MBB6690871.1 glycoside hydrolase family 88 protein [Cohnella xylanilytica]